MPQMSPLWWFYLMLMFWLSWMSISMMIFYWMNLSVLISHNSSSLSPLSFFFFFFYFSEGELCVTCMSNKIDLINFMFVYLYNFELFGLDDL